MRIITRGRDPSTIEYECTCHNCRTVFVFYKREATIEPRDGGYQVKCPLCSKQTHMRHLKEHVAAVAGYWPDR